MVKVCFLGSSYSVPDENHENTHLVVISDEQAVMVDCTNSPLQRLSHAGVSPDSLTDLILTHFHPDHVSGVPLFLMDLWLLKRRRPLNIYGLEYTLDRIEAMMGLYNWQRWPEFFPVVFHRLPEAELTTVIDQGEYRIQASPVKHLVPTIGLRIEATKSHRVLAYSCDTEPCEATVHLGQRAQVFVHEATGATPGHSSAQQAGEIATQAEAETLYLVHYIPKPENHLIEEAKTTFSKKVALIEDYMTFEMR